MDWPLLQYINWFSVDQIIAQIAKRMEGVGEEWKFFNPYPELVQF